MSAYVVSEDTILTLALYAAGIDRASVDLDAARLYAQQLYTANVVSVEYLYRFSDPAQAGVGAFDRSEDVDVSDLLRLQHWFRDPVAMLKLAMCFDYQSCEHPGWRDSEAYALVQRIQAEAISRLPGYDDAPWGLA